MDRSALQFALYEISISIGNSFELNEMLDEAASVILSHLNCFSASVYQRTDDGFELCFAKPKERLKNSRYQESVESLQQMFIRTPQSFMEIHSGEDFYYLFELENFGVLILARAGSGFDDYTLHVLQKINSKLVNAIKACIHYQSLESKRQKLLDTQRIAKVGSWEFDVKTNQLEWSPETYKIFECDPERFQPDLESFKQLVHPDDRTKVIRVFEKSFQENRDFQIEHRVLVSDGRIKYVFEHAYTLFDEQGSPVRSLGTVQDITDQKLIEKELNQREKELETIFEAIPLMLFVKEAQELRFVRFNAAGEKLLGHNRNELLGKNDYDFFPSEQADFFVDKDRKTLNSGQVTVIHEESINTPEGPKVLHTIKVGIPGENGEPKYLLGISEDITEFKAANERLKQSEKQLREAQKVAKLGHYVLDIRSGSWTSSEELDRIFGIDEAFERDVESWASLVHPDEQEAMIAYLTNDVLGRKEPFDKEYRIVSQKDGRTIWVHGLGSLELDKQGKVLQMFGTIQDISERKQREQELRQSSTIIANLAEGIMITDAQNRYININPAFSRITGYSLEEVKGRTPNILYSGRHDRGFYAQMWQSIHEKGAWQGEIWNRRKNGDVYPEWLSISSVKDDKGQVLNYIGVFSDISTIKESEEELRFLAHHDALTKLPNRVLLNDRIEHALTSIRRTKLNLAVLYLDLDRFKAINDSFGHPQGDLLLQIIASRLKTALRQNDTVSRVSGDEFVILLEDLHSSEEAGLIARKVLEAVGQPVLLEETEVTVTASIGIAMAPADATEAVQLLKNADTALYRAKDMGRNNFEFFSSDMSASSFETLFMLNGLYKALDNKEFVAYYQPQVDMVDKRLVGVEALVRWQHSEMGLVPPGKFIPLAEDSGVILKLGEWVLREACMQIKRWQAQGVAVDYIAVNLSGRQLIDKNLISIVSSALQEAGIEGRHIELEVTETLVMKEASYSKVIQGLKALGVRISIDDFGTGYSSLVRLKYLPIDKLKIDMSFIKGVPDDEDDANITRTIINLAHGMKLNVIAEGVEADSQAQFLIKHQCRLAQGYLYSPPLPARDLESWIKKFCS